MYIIRKTITKLIYSYYFNSEIDFSNHNPFRSEKNKATDFG